MLVASGFAARFSAVFAAVWLVGALAVAQAAPQDGADAYPSRTVRMIVPFPAGGPTSLAGWLPNA